MSKNKKKNLGKNLDKVMGYLNDAVYVIGGVRSVIRLVGFVSSKLKDSDKEASSEESDN